MTENVERAVTVAEDTALVPRSIPELIAILSQDPEGMKDKVEVIERLVALNERQELRENERQFNAAFAKFQADCPMIPKSRTAKGPTRDGQKGGFSFKYADIEEIGGHIAPVLKEVGLSYSFRQIPDDDRHVHVECTLQHVGGHKIVSAFRAPIDASMRVNETQKFGAAQTYSKRQALVAILGLTMCEDDTDGMAPGATDRINSNQVRVISAQLAELGASEEGFLNYMEVDSLDNILASDWAKAMTALTQYRQRLAERVQQEGSNEFPR